MARDGYRGGAPKYDFSFVSIFRGTLVVLIPFCALSLGLFPSAALFIYIIQFLNILNPLHILFLCFLIVAAFVLLMFCEILIPALLIKILRLRYEEGLYEMSIRDKTFYKFVVFNVLYQAPLKLIGPFRFMILRRLIYKLSGIKLAKTCILSGTEVIFDPSVTEIGEDTFIGGHAKIYGHMFEDKFLIKKVRIGNRCLIGADSSIMPGAIIEDDVTLGLRSLVVKNQVLKQGRTYGGVPAKEIKKQDILDIQTSVASSEAVSTTGLVEEATR